MMTCDWFSKLAKLVLLSCSATLGLGSPGWAQQVPEPSAAASSLGAPTFMSYARFKIPFQVEAKNPALAQVQLWVSTDDGQSWQIHGTVEPDAKHFDFKAAAEGLYYFSVQTIDATGVVFPSQSPPLKVLVDTTKPEAAIRADVSPTGKLVVDLRVRDDHLDPRTAALRMRTEREPHWRDIHVGELVRSDGIYETQVVLDLPAGREVALAFAISDKANNSGEATYQFRTPRTAAGDAEMTLASNPTSPLTPPTATRTVSPQEPPTIPGAVAWKPVKSRPTKPSLDDSPVGMESPGRLVNSPSQLALQPSTDNLPAGTPEGLAEELPPPTEVEMPAPRRPDLDNEPRSVAAPTGPGQAFHCKSRAFSLDYSVDALGGGTLADVELWGTEDGGRTWQQWGADPDRTSPFDVQVGNDGLFGFCMVVVGTNGLVSERPKDGERADVWIDVDTSIPQAKITRAVYGEGEEEGMLVVDYTCQDDQLVDRPITLSFSEAIDGPWTTITTGQQNTGSYRWKAEPHLPDRIYLRLQAVDKAGNVGLHRLDLPIDTRGLAPRGRIQGVRPILEQP